MNSLYPSLQEKFQAESICPICMMGMGSSLKYLCADGHMMCYRCKPYYYSCPICNSPLNVEMPRHEEDTATPLTCSLPYPLHPSYPMPHGSPEYQPSAPPATDDFIHHERNHDFPHANHPVPEGNQYPAPSHELELCQFSSLGCGVKIPKRLVEMHETRCQFRPHLEEENLPTDFIPDCDERVTCCYRQYGCKMQVLPWRKHVHEQYCYYKKIHDQALAHSLAEEFETVHLHADHCYDHDRLYDCKFKRYGCMVRMRGYRKALHEEKCNYAKYYASEDEEEENEHSSEVRRQSCSSSSDAEENGDPDEQLECRWSECGCRVRPKRSRKNLHEAKCNYRMESCSYRDHGCHEMLQPARKYAHERHCPFAC